MYYSAELENFMYLLHSCGVNIVLMNCTLDKLNSMFQWEYYFNFCATCYKMDVCGTRFKNIEKKYFTQVNIVFS